MRPNSPGVDLLLRSSDSSTAVQVTLDLGKFDTEEEAARAYDRAVLWSLGLTAPINLPLTEHLRPGPTDWITAPASILPAKRTASGSVAASGDTQSGTAGATDEGADGSGMPGQTEVAGDAAAVDAAGAGPAAVPDPHEAISALLPPKASTLKAKMSKFTVCVGIMRGGCSASETSGSHAFCCGSCHLCVIRSDQLVLG